MDYTLLSNIICRVVCGESHGTAFFINCKIAITAFHVLEDLSQIKLYFDGKEEAYNAKYIKPQDYNYEEIDIALLEIEKELNTSDFLEFVNRDINPKEEWTSRAYPIVKGNEGNNFLGSEHIIQQQLVALKNNKYDIELEHDQKLSSYKGVSGSPLIINGRIAGVINSELTERGESKELCAISTKYFCKLLKSYDINIVIDSCALSNKLDNSGASLWEKTIPSDKRNLSDKIKSVCTEISNRRINKYNRDVTYGKIELELFSERIISALKFRIFEACQNELINFVERSVSLPMTSKDVDNLIEIFTSKAELIIKDKSKDYSYSDISNRDLLRKIVLDLIDECYLSFDEEGIYEE